MGPIEEKIHAKLTARFQPTVMEVANESHTHNVPKDSETHFRVLVVSAQFANLSRVARSRLIHETLADELKNGVHALSHRSYTPDEWAKLGESIEMVSPPCLGGSKK